jgi:hypothetical protein
MVIFRIQIELLKANPPSPVLVASLLKEMQSLTGEPSGIAKEPIYICKGRMRSYLIEK